MQMHVEHAGRSIKALRPDYFAALPRGRFDPRDVTTFCAGQVATNLTNALVNPSVENFAN
jgi:hypothetical protein